MSFEGSGHDERDVAAWAKQWQQNREVGNDPVLDLRVLKEVLANSLLGRSAEHTVREVFLQEKAMLQLKNGVMACNSIPELSTVYRLCRQLQAWPFYDLPDGGAPPPLQHEFSPVEAWIVFHRLGRDLQDASVSPQMQQVWREYQENFYDTNDPRNQDTYVFSETLAKQVNEFIQLIEERAAGIEILQHRRDFFELHATAVVETMFDSPLHPEVDLLERVITARLRDANPADFNESSETDIARLKRESPLFDVFAFAIPHLRLSEHTLHRATTESTELLKRIVQEVLPKRSSGEEQEAYKEASFLLRKHQELIARLKSPGTAKSEETEAQRKADERVAELKKHTPYNQLYTLADGTEWWFVQGVTQEGQVVEVFVPKNELAAYIDIEPGTSRIVVKRETSHYFYINALLDKIVKRQQPQPTPPESSDITPTGE